MFEVRDKPNRVERAMLISVYFNKNDAEESDGLLVELNELVKTLRIGVVDRVSVKVVKRNARYLMGKGKKEELAEHARDLECDCIVFDNELSPAQQRAWEEDSGICVIDRQEVILDIFADRAQTKEARLQVELARLEYSLPRLTRMWGHLDRQGGGGPGNRGGGETQLETDRRLAHKRIDRVKAELATVRKQRGTQRKEREKLPVPHAAIVGYTNAGKSSLLNRITGSDVLAEDKLFATLDTTTRKIELPDGQSLLLTDTVGFVRQLPHRLVEAFKATLEEAVLADFLIHVLDASQALIFEFHQTTLEVLKELGAEGKPMLVVINKIDLLEDPAARQQLETHFEDACFISVETGEGMDLLIHRINDMLLDRVNRLRLRIPQSRNDLVSLLHREGKVLTCEYEENDVITEVVLSKTLQGPFEDYIEPTPANAPDEARIPE
ncbi:MAG: GTPase HflX [Verrucomicrobiota bacterium]